MDDSEFDELERRFLSLQSNIPIETPLNIAPEQNVNDMEARLQQLMRAEDVEMLGTSDLEQIPTSDSVQAEFDALMNDEERELESASGNIDGGGNTQSKIILFDDLDSDDDFIDNIDSNDESKSDIFKLKVDELSYLLQSIKINNGCDDVINFCKTSKQLKNDCSNIPEIRDNIYTPCLIELMIMKVNSINIDYDSMDINRKDLLELEKENRGSVYDFLTNNLDCSDLLKKHLLEIINESIRQVYIDVSEDFLEIMNISKIPISFLIYTIKNIKDIFKSKNLNKLDTFSISVKNKSKPILEYQLAKIETLKTDISIYEIYDCFIQYLKILLSYNLDNI